MLHGHIVQLFLFLQSSSRYERMRFSGCWWWFATHCGSNWVISPRNKNVWKHKLDSRIMEGKKDQRVGNSIKAKVIQAVTFWSNHWKSLNHSKRGHKKKHPKKVTLNHRRLEKSLTSFRSFRKRSSSISWLVTQGVCYVNLGFNRLILNVTCSWLSLLHETNLPDYQIWPSPQRNRVKQQHLVWNKQLNGERGHNSGPKHHYVAEYFHSFICWFALYLDWACRTVGVTTHSFPISHPMSPCWFVVEWHLLLSMHSLLLQCDFLLVLQLVSYKNGHFNQTCFYIWWETDSDACII